MDNTSTTAWVVGAILVLLVIGALVVWYNSSTSPGIPNTGTQTAEQTTNFGSMSSTTY